MGLHPQPNDWTCGPFALKHALVALGRMVDGEDLAEVAGSHWWSGTDEIRLSRAARAYDTDLVFERALNPERARKALSAILKRGVPAILCVDDWGHWVTVVRQEKSDFVLIDSDMDPVLNLVTWPQLQKRWVYYDYDYDENDPPSLYDLFAVEPRFRVQMKADFSAARVKFLRRPENRNLATYWNVYLEDLLAICEPPTNRSWERLSMAELLRRHGEMILRRVSYWHGEVERAELEKLMRNYRFVAETYGLVIPKENTRRAIADLSILAALWSAATRGVGDMYGSGER